VKGLIIIALCIASFASTPLSAQAARPQQDPAAAGLPAQFKGMQISAPFELASAVSTGAMFDGGHYYYPIAYAGERAVLIRFDYAVQAAWALELTYALGLEPGTYGQLVRAASSLGERSVGGTIYAISPASIRLSRSPLFDAGTLPRLEDSETGPRIVEAPISVTMPAGTMILAILPDARKAI
jgi:hypothetical protein